MTRIGLLRPKKRTDAGYRVYGCKEVDMLQQILFYRELGVDLKRIKAIMAAPAFERMAALAAHLTALKERRKKIDALVANVEKTISAEKGETAMTDSEKFEGFKQKMIDDNEERYGEEIRAKYG